ncbi:hypothetical protein EZV62_005570 [Acer yangbiense]|uniref:Uncharacterized protein n=1 Tax=Acer yangbiense TaxID=1000413 RepID=A0A5C7IN61_9ROSI|nr:hypothetical protein EZV62_005570 [Acer yangbiense]
MFGGGKSMGGGGGGMLRTVGRVVTARAGHVTNLQEPISSSSSSSNTNTPTSPTSNSRHTHKQNLANHLSLSAPLCYHNVPVSPTSGVPIWPYFGTATSNGSDDWVYVDEISDDDKSHGFVVDESVLGPVPSLDEVNNAVSAIQQVFDPVSYSHLVRDKFGSNLEKDVVDQISSSSGLGHHVASIGSELDWMEPAPYPSYTRMLQPYGYDRVYDAFHLLQTEPSIQRMVISLSSDRDVWNAVLNNKVVRELKESFEAAESNGSEIESSDETCDNSNPAMDIVKWIFNNTKAKVVEVIEKITNIVNELFKPPGDEKATNGAATAGATDPFEEKLRTSFLLSIVVLLVVFVTRASKA